MNRRHPQNLLRARAWLAAPIAGLSLFTSSCALPTAGNTTAAVSVNDATLHADYIEEVDQAEETSPDAVAEATSPPSTPVIQQMSHVEEWPALPPGQVHPFAPPVTAAASASPPGTLNSAHYSTDFLPADPRVILPAESLSLKNCPMPWEEGRCPPTATCPPAGTCPPPQACPTPPIYEPDVFADEYLCDGGDRGPKVNYVGNERHGLDTEDTIAEFVDHTGQCHTKPSTRVCIYAPQFAAVRSASLPLENLAIDRVAGAHDGRPTAGLDAGLAPNQQVKHDQPTGLNIRSRVSGLDTDTTEDALAQIVTVENHQKLINVFEDRAFLSEGRLDAAIEAYLAYVVQAAGEWTRDLNPVIIAIDAGGQELITTFQAKEYKCVEDLRKPGDLKIIKMADKKAARPGDIVTFTIRFENVGERELSQIRILDNLTPRLEFIEGSGHSDLNGRLDVEDNGEGSLVLRFELEESLPGKSGGTVTFQCRVR